MKRGILVPAIWGLVLYLGLFSGFALLHAYGQDELADAHGCVIGAWVQHANATDPSTAPPVPLPCFLGLLETASNTALLKALPSATSRGPPSRA
ncbi:MAG: hypothetical protein AB1451_03000 [Nitrospirota bacterium]